MNKLEATKKVTSIIVGIGTSKVVGDIIKTNTQPRHLFDRISIGATSIVTGSMAAAATKEHSGQMIDQIAESLQKFKKN